jgi:hypothetical protein
MNILINGIGLLDGLSKILQQAGQSYVALLNGIMCQHAPLQFS